MFLPFTTPTDQPGTGAVFILLRVKIQRETDKLTDKQSNRQTDGQTVIEGNSVKRQTQKQNWIELTVRKKGTKGKKIRPAKKIQTLNRLNRDRKR